MSQAHATAERPVPPVTGKADVVPAANDLLPLEVRGLCLTIAGQLLLNDVSFRLDAGAPTVILGPNGAGKSLLLRVCHGLLRPTAGAVRWGGLDSPSAQRRQAMVFQRPVLLRRSVAANVAYALAVKGVARADRHGLAAEALGRAGLSHLAGRPARVLSGGEQQRLAIARAWATRPDVLLLDEPSSHLDPGSTRHIEALVADIAASGAKVVMTTHDLGQARRLAGDVMFLHHGRVLAHQRGAEFFDRPAHPDARCFVDGDLLD
jgi:tungstate transport system ATP-binding protein